MPSKKAKSAKGNCAMLIGDKTGPAIIALTYGDVRPDHLMQQAKRIRLTVQGNQEGSDRGSSNKSSNTLPDVSACLAKVQQAAEAVKTAVLQGV